MKRDLRLERVYPHPPERVWRAVAERKGAHDRDSVGVIVFGRYPRLELAPSETASQRRGAFPWSESMEAEQRQFQSTEPTTTTK